MLVRQSHSGKENDMQRRHALGIFSGAAAAPLILSARTARTDHHTLLDAGSQADRAVIYRKLNYTYDDRLVVWYIQARRNGLVDSKFTPFWDMNVGFISTVRDISDDEYEVKTLSAIFYTDIETGVLLDTFNNPYTGETVAIRPPRLGNSTRRYVSSGMVSDRASREGYDMSQYGNIGPAWVIGDDVWIQGDTGFRAEPTTSEGQLSVVNDWFTFHGSISDVSDPDVKSASATQAFNDINTWPGFLNMGGIAGNYVSRGFGRKVSDVSEMPEVWQRLMKDLFPAAYRDPRSALEG